MEYTKSLARFVSKTTFEELPKDVIGRAKQCILDALGAMLAASTTKEGQRFIEFAMIDGDRGESTIVGAKKTSCLSAAFANGTLAEILELDDGSRIMCGHPSSVVIPASLAVGESRKANGEDVITSIVLGYDIAIRVGGAMFPYHRARGFLNTGTSGTFGATAAAGKILGLDEEAMASAFGIAGFFVPASLSQSRAGTTIKPAHAGQAAQVAVKSALLAEKGFSATHSILEGPSGFCQATADKFDLDRLTDKLGEKYEIMDVYFKPHACCRHSHGAIDATLELIAKYRIKPHDVESVIVRTNSGASRVVCQYAKPSDPYTSFQFSLPYVVAIALTDGEVGLAQFDEAKRKDPEIHELMRKIKCALDPELDRLYLQDRRPTAVEIVTKKGERLSARVDFPKGSSENPLSKQELASKFRELASKVIDENKTENIIKLIEGMEEEVSNIDKLMALLRLAN